MSRSGSPQPRFDISDLFPFSLRGRKVKTPCYFSSDRVSGVFFSLVHESKLGAAILLSQHACKRAEVSSGPWPAFPFFFFFFLFSFLFFGCSDGFPLFGWPVGKRGGDASRDFLLPSLFPYARQDLIAVFAFSFPPPLLAPLTSIAAEFDDDPSILSSPPAGGEKRKTGVFSFVPAMTESDLLCLSGGECEKSGRRFSPPLSRPTHEEALFFFRRTSMPLPLSLGVSDIVETTSRDRRFPFFSPFLSVTHETTKHPWSLLDFSGPDSHGKSENGHSSEFFSPLFFSRDSLEIRGECPFFLPLSSPAPSKIRREQDGSNLIWFFFFSLFFTFPADEGRQKWDIECPRVPLLSEEEETPFPFSSGREVTLPLFYAGFSLRVLR